MTPSTATPPAEQPASPPLAATQNMDPNQQNPPKRWMQSQNPQAVETGEQDKAAEGFWRRASSAGTRRECNLWGQEQWGETMPRESHQHRWAMGKVPLPHHCLGCFRLLQALPKQKGASPRKVSFHLLEHHLGGTQAVPRQASTLAGASINGAPKQTMPTGTLCDLLQLLVPWGPRQRRGCRARG